MNLRTFGATATLITLNFVIARVQFDGPGWPAVSLRATQILRCDPPNFVATLFTTVGPARTWATPLDALDWLSRNQTQSWYGFLSYDLGRYFETLPTHSLDDRELPLFAFIAGEPINPIAAAASPPPQVLARPTFSRAEYESRIARCLDYIRAGDVFQINLSQRFRVPTVEPPTEVYARLQSQTPAKYAAFLDFGDFQLLSNSPELFLEQDVDRRVTTRPIKGTRALRERADAGASRGDLHRTYPNLVVSKTSAEEGWATSVRRENASLDESKPPPPIQVLREPIDDGATPPPTRSVKIDVAPPLPEKVEDADARSALRQSVKDDATPMTRSTVDDCANLSQRNTIDDRAAPPIADVLRDSVKDAAELNMIIDLERNDLGRVCEIGSVKVTQPRTIETHPTVVHGVATIQGRLRRESTFVDLLRATFPGGSITGAPKIRAMQIIDELEPHRRGPYCGAIGVIRPDGTHTFNIAIRTIVLRDGVADVQVGGGIVADSVPSEEYEETIVKARAMFEALGVVGVEGKKATADNAD